MSEPAADPKAAATAKPTEPPAQPAAPAEELPEGLGDAGKQAIDRMKAERDAAKKEAAAFKAQIDALNQANESAVEKAQRQAKEAQEAAGKAQADALRFRIAAESGITENVDLILTGSDEQTMRAQAQLWADKTSPTSPRPDLTQGSKGQPATGDPAQDFANFMGAQLGGR